MQKQGELVASLAATRPVFVNLLPFLRGEKDGETKNAPKIRFRATHVLLKNIL